MKSPYQIAKECGVSSQAVYQKIDRMKEQLTPHIQRDGKKILLNIQGENLLKSTFLNIVEQDIKQEKKKIEYSIEQSIEQGLLKQLNIENEYLREQNKILLQELSKERQEVNKEREQIQTILEKEREHSRQQAERLAELTEKLTELTKNEQILMLQSKNAYLLPEEQETVLSEDSKTQGNNKPSLWQKLFKNKKNR